MIPRIIHQTWRDTDIPAPLAAFAETWRRHHPRLAYRLWTDADLAALVEADYPELAAIFHAYPEPIMRVDLGRYLILRSLGGIYADLDAEALAPWDAMLGATRPIFAEEPPSHAALEFVRSRGFRRIVSNAVIASPAGHPFWDHLIALMRRCRSAEGPLDATGPFVLTAAVESAPADTLPQILPAYLTSPADKDGAPVTPPGPDTAALAWHHWRGTWWAPRPSPVHPPGAEALWRPGWRHKLRERGAKRRLAVALKAAKELPPETPPAGGRILILVPVRDAAPTLDALFASILALDYPKRDIGIAFLEGDSADDSAARLRAFADAHRGDYARIEIFRRRFGSPRYDFRGKVQYQRERRAHLARVRNHLLARALRDEDWVLWIDADVVHLPRDLIPAMLGARARVVQPNTVIEPGGPTFDRNAWVVERVQSEEAKRPFMLHGLYQPPGRNERLYLSDLRYRERVVLDSVGGTVLLVDAKLHRAGIDFPETPYRHLIETEGLGALLRDHGIEIVGLPNLEARHANA